MITNIKKNNSTTIEYTDEGVDCKLTMRANGDNNNYIDIKFCEQQEITIPIELISVFINSLAEFNR